MNATPDYVGATKMRYQAIADDNDPFRKVSHRMPARPRLRVETFDGQHLYDLLPHIEFGEVVPDQWALPSVRTFHGWKPEIASTQVLRERMERVNRRVRILTE